MKFAPRASARIFELCDAESFVLQASDALSPHLARWGISPLPGDGVVLGRAGLAGREIFVAAQEPSFLGGAVGALQAQRLAAHLREALHAYRRDEISGVLLLIESGGVRLHEANPALLGLAAVLQALTDLRAAAVPVVAVIPGSGGAFGGMSVIACACCALFFGAGARLGVSGPKVLETLRGKAAFDADHEPSVDGVFGAAVRAARGMGRPLPASPVAAKAAIAAALDAAASLPLALDVLQNQLLSRLREAGKKPASNPGPSLFTHGRSVDQHGWITRNDAGEIGVLQEVAPAALGPAQALAMGLALRQWTREAAPESRLFVREDSPGHEASLEAETLGLSQYLAFLALCHAEARAAGRKEIGLLTGTGVSAAFFSNALQAPELYATANGRVRLMDLRAMERVTGLARSEVEKLLAEDPVFGQEARHLQSWGGLTGMFQSLSVDELERLAAKS